ncbi:MAG: LLM class F420-dependent oxidoreductase [Actinobacteria bacterium]|nr:LLM class F420-dependent oxidoreductase [Actinomycetota bacterium]MCL6105068.1 LLM class F420-dependent oxidoreductase [Actinomycetota bacterium]
MSRYGISIPLSNTAFSDQQKLISTLSDLGYSDIWSVEAEGMDAFTPLALGSYWGPKLRLGTAVISVFTRGPALIAMSAASMAEIAPGRFVLGIGSSSDVIVQNWNSIKFERPWSRVRDTLRFLRLAFTGEKVTEEFDTFSVRGFRLGRPLSNPPPILLGALRPRMLKLAGEEADGVILNWLSPSDTAKVVAEFNKAVGNSGEGQKREIVTRIFVCPSTDSKLVYQQGRYALGGYLNVDVYADFHRWLGRGEYLQPMWQAWEKGERKRAVEAVPNEVIDDLIVHGSPKECREKINRYIENGATTVVLAVLPFCEDESKAVEDLAPVNNDKTF